MLIIFTGERERGNIYKQILGQANFKTGLFSWLIKTLKNSYFLLLLGIKVEKGWSFKKPIKHIPNGKKIIWSILKQF